MTVPEMITEKLLESTITVGMLRGVMEAEAVDMATAENMIRNKLLLCVDYHIAGGGWLKKIDASCWTDPDNEDEAKEAIDEAKTGGYIEGYLDGFADAIKAGFLLQERSTGDND